MNNSLFETFRNGHLENTSQPVYSTDVRRKSSVLNGIVLAGGGSLSFLCTFCPEWTAARAWLQDGAETPVPLSIYDIEAGTPDASQVLKMPVVLEKDTALCPMHIRFFGGIWMVFDADGSAQLVEEVLRLG